MQGTLKPIAFSFYALNSACVYNAKAALAADIIREYYFRDFEL